MEDREFSSPVCYLDFDHVPATPAEPGVQEEEADSAGETSALVAEALVPVAPGPFVNKGASAASPPAASIAAPLSRCMVACAVDSNLAPATHKAAKTPQPNALNSPTDSAQDSRKRTPQSQHSPALSTMEELMSS